MATTAKIIPIRGAIRPLTLQLDQLNGYESVKLLAKLIHEWTARGPEYKVKLLAKKSGLLPKTVSRIMYRETKAPRLETCLLLFKALGFSAIRLE